MVSSRLGSKSSKYYFLIHIRGIIRLFGGYNYFKSPEGLFLPETEGTNTLETLDTYNQTDMYHHYFCIRAHKIALSHNLWSSSAVTQCNKLQKCNGAISLFAPPLPYNNVVTNGAQMTSFVMTLL